MRSNSAQISSLSEENQTPALALPYWRQAQTKIEETLGLQATLSLNGLLDLFSSKLAG